MNLGLDNKLVFLAGSTGLAGTSIMQNILNNHPSTRIRASWHQTEPFFKHERVEYVRGNLISLEDSRRMAKGCDCAIMAAAFSAGAGIMTTEPWRYVNTNVSMNSQMLEAFHFEGINRVVFISSATLYQEHDGFIKEDDLDMNIEPHAVYYGIGWTMRFIEKLCRFWHDKTGMEVAIIRAANIYGPFAKFDPKTSNFIPAIIRKAVDKMEPFEVWGSPDVTRDVIYSDDFASAAVMLLYNKDISFNIFNIGSGAKTAVEDVVGWALKYSGHEPSAVNYVSDKPTTVKSRVLDCSKAREMLGWEINNTPEKGVKKTTEWWIKNRDWWKR
jgi:GDP-L-fucose synthase